MDGNIDFGADRIDTKMEDENGEKLHRAKGGVKKTPSEVGGDDFTE